MNMLLHLSPGAHPSSPSPGKVRIRSPRGLAVPAGLGDSHEQDLGFGLEQGEGLSVRGGCALGRGSGLVGTRRGHGRDKEGTSHLSQHFPGCLWLQPLQPLPREQQSAANRRGSGVTVSGVLAGGGPSEPGEALWGRGCAGAAVLPVGCWGKGLSWGPQSSPCARGFGAGSNPEVRLELSQLPSTRSRDRCRDGGKILFETKPRCPAEQAGREGARSRLGLCKAGSCSAGALRGLKGALGPVSRLRMFPVPLCAELQLAEQLHLGSCVVQSSAKIL